MSTGFQMHFNQDFTSICVLNNAGLRLFSINGCDKIDEIFCKDNEHIRLAERLFNSSLVVLVTEEKPNCLKMLHFKKKQDICNCVYPSDILCVRMNRHRLIVCLAESIHIHDIRDMSILQSIENIAPNELGLCSMALNSQLAFPICSTSGELRIYNANKLTPGLSIKAHNSKLSALSFSPNGTLLATASERGTVIRVFCVRNGQRVQEFRRGVKRCVRIASLVFSTSGDFLCTSSNTETVHIFKIDTRAVDAAERKPLLTETQNALTSATAANQATTLAAAASASSSTESTATSATSAASTTTTASNTLTNNNNSSSWSGFLSKAVSSYFIPTQVSDVLAQDRAFATAFLTQPGLKHVCGLTRIQKELKVLIACEDGFLYIYDFNAERGGQCKMQNVHDLRCALDGVIELNLTDSISKVSVAAQNIAKSKDDVAICTKELTIKTGIAGSVIIENPEPMPDNSYAGILKGSQATQLLSDSAKFRKLCDAIDTPTKLYDERQFPPVAIAAKD